MSLINCEISLSLTCSDIYFVIDNPIDNQVLTIISSVCRNKRY